MRFQPCLDFTWRPENDGQDSHKDPNDPGGWTRYGVTIATWLAYQSLEHLDVDFAEATQDQLRYCLYRLFFVPVHAAQLPPGLDLCVWDIGVMSSPGRAAKYLQSCLNVRQDGIVGDETLKAIDRMGDKPAIDALTGSIEKYYASLPTFRIFGHGWDRRAEDRRQLAYQMAGIST